MMARGCSLGVLAGLLVVAFESSDFQGEICEYNQATKHEDCTTYSLFPFLLIKVFDTLNYYGVAITALATVFIGVFTLTLKLSTDNLWTAAKDQIAAAENAAKMQSRDMQASIAVAQSAANAANKSAKVAEDALTVLEKPYVFIDRRIALSKSIMEIKDFKALNADSLCHIGVEYFIINHGRTPAIIKNLTTTMLIVANIPEHRTITGTPEIPTAIGMAQGVPDGPLKCLSNEAATVVICDEILRGCKFLFFYGQISYRDVFSYEYLTGFGWRYFVNANIWNPAGGDEYNFHMNVSPEPMKKAPFRF